MGTLTLPPSGAVYLDTVAVIYAVERHPLFFGLLRPLLAAVQAGQLDLATSELTLMETLVGPLRAGNAALAAAYEGFFQQSGVRLLPVSQTALRAAAQLRADTKLRTPDAIHLASATLAGRSRASYPLY